MVWASFARAETLALSPTDDSTIRPNSSNQGTSTILFAGDTAAEGDYLRSVLAFDLDQPELAGATIHNATLTLTIGSLDSGTSGDQQNTIDLHQLSTPFTNGGVSWTSRDGVDNWNSPGGDFGGVLASLVGNAGTVKVGDTFAFSSPSLTSAAAGAGGGSLNLLAKLATEDANRSVFRFAPQDYTANAAYRPTLSIEYTPGDPQLSQDLVGGDPDLDFGVLSGEPPASATRTLRFVNEGPTNPIMIEGASLSGSGVFAIHDIVVNGIGGQSLPLVLQVGDSLSLDVSATFSAYESLAAAILTLDTSVDSEDRQFAISASLASPGSPLPHPAIPGRPASASYQVRVNGLPVPVNDESYFDFHTAFFSMGDPVMVEIECSPGITFSSIHPLRHGIHPRGDGNTISFPLLKPLKLVIKAAGALPLALCATPQEENVPSPGDPGVIYFGLGTHEPGVLQPLTGQTIYLAPGALVKGRIEVSGASNVSIRGRGTLDADGYSVRGQSTQGLRVQSSNNVHVSGIGLRGGTNWMTLFVLSDDCSATHLSLLGKTVNTDGIDIDGVQRFVARDCFIRCEDDGFGWHAVSAETYGEPPTRDCLAEDCVIWNTAFGNGLRVGASMETEIFENITFRNIDVLEHAGAAIYSDHSDWALCRNIRFENFTDETTKQTIDIFIDKTRYSNSTGFRDERGRYDGLEFTNVNSPGGGIRLRGFSADHLIENVSFRDCHNGGVPVDGSEDIVTNAFVSGVTFEVDADPPLKMRHFRLVDGESGWIQLGFTSRYGIRYSIEASPELGITNPFTGLLKLSGSGPSSEALFFDPAAIGALRRFYRVAED